VSEKQLDSTATALLEEVFRMVSVCAGIEVQTTSWAEHAVSATFKIFMPPATPETQKKTIEQMVVAQVSKTGCFRPTQNISRVIIDQRKDFVADILFGKRPVQVRGRFLTQGPSRVLDLELEMSINAETAQFIEKFMENETQGYDAKQKDAAGYAIFNVMMESLSVTRTEVTAHISAITDASKHWAGRFTTVNEVVQAAARGLQSHGLQKQNGQMLTSNDQNGQKFIALINFDGDNSFLGNCAFFQNNMNIEIFHTGHPDAVHARERTEALRKWGAGA